MFLGRDGGKSGNALTTARYRTVVFQAYSNRDVAAGLMWFNCARALVASSCGGGMPFTLSAGWHTYVLNPGASVYSGWPLAWGGTVNGLRLVVSAGAAGSDFSLDWFRLVQPGSGAQISWSNANGGSSQIVWDSDTSDVNNTTSSTGWASDVTQVGFANNISYVGGSLRPPTRRTTPSSRSASARVASTRASTGTSPKRPPITVCSTCATSPAAARWLGSSGPGRTSPRWAPSPSPGGTPRTGRYWLCLRITRGSAATSGYAGGVLVVRK